MEALNQQRNELLNSLYHTQTEGTRMLVHGSIAHAALRAVDLPPVRKLNGDTRDVDVHISAQSGEIDAFAIVATFGSNIPVDPGMSDILIRDGDSFIAAKSGVQVELEAAEVFGEEHVYELPGTDGIRIRSFTPLGMYALHMIQPGWAVRPHHPVMDNRFLAHCWEQGLVLPSRLESSIRTFHREYNQRYRYGNVLTAASQIYANALPEATRNRFRARTHAMMKRYAGRQSPFAE